MKKSLYYFMPYIKGKGVRDLYLIRIGRKTEIHPDVEDTKAPRLVLEIEYLESLPKYKMIHLNFQHSFTDTFLGRVMMTRKSPPLSDVEYHYIKNSYYRINDITRIKLKDKMNVLYILGNGFDKAQGMKTSYPEFYQYLMEKNDSGSDLLQQLKNDINVDKELWSDMEEAFGKFTSKIQTNEELEKLYFELSENLQRYLLEEENSFAPSNNLKTKFQSDFISPSKYLGATDRTSYNEFEKKMPGGQEINVMSLNYTNTLERLLSLDKNTDKAFSNSIYLRQIIHVHGKLDDSIIIGVDNEQQIANEKFRENDDIKDFLVKVQSNHAMKYTRHNTCEKLIESAHLIILYGVSLGETDARWWKLIGEQFKKRNTLCVIQFLYLPNQITQTRKQLLGRFERRQRRCIMQKFGFKENEWPEDTINRLFFVVNSNTFKL